MRVDLDKRFDKDAFDTIKTVILPGKSPPKLVLGKISNVNIFKLVQITKQVDNFRQGLSHFDIKLSNTSAFIITCSYFTDYRFFT